MRVQVPPSAPRRSKVRFAPTYFFAKISHPPASLLLLFREKSRSVRPLICMRTRDGSQSLPTFHDIALRRDQNPLPLLHVWASPVRTLAPSSITGFEGFGIFSQGPHFFVCSNACSNQPRSPAFHRIICSKSLLISTFVWCCTYV